MTDEWKVVLGTSNVKRNYDPKKFEFEPYTVKKCCRMETFKAEAAMLTDANQFIVPSVGASLCSWPTKKNSYGCMATANGIQTYVCFEKVF